MAEINSLYNPKKTKILFATLIMLLAITALFIVVLMMLTNKEEGPTPSTTAGAQAAITTEDSSPEATPTPTPTPTPAGSSALPTPTPTPTTEVGATVSMPYSATNRGSMIRVDAANLYYSEISMPASKDLGNHLVYTEKKLADSFGFVNVYLKKSSGSSLIS